MIEIPLKRRGVVVAHAVVDDADGYLAAFRWRMDSKGYVVRTVRTGRARRCVRLARAVLGLRAGDPRQADHINRDKLDNRRANLRAVTGAQNVQNKGSYAGSSSSFRGVSRAGDRWRARARLDGRLHHLGFYEREEDAAAAAAAFRREHMPYSVEAA